ncbi:MAG: ANTAR domain-containing protein [Clostridia bacterium]|nr:ANTAR domain-containing protein [Clostridia bacterium]
MPYKEHLYSVLIVSASDKFNGALGPLLPPATYTPVKIVGSIAEAQRQLLERFYDLVIINTPLPDDFGRKFAVELMGNRGESSTVVLLCVKNELYAEIYEKVMDYGIFTLRKPLSLQMIVQALDWMCAMRQRLCGLEKKTVSLEDKMAEIRIVNRAKWALIEVCKMTEADAHRYIEKQAMDRCISKKEVAEGILQTYQV